LNLLRIVIHGFIDGYSRLTSWPHASKKTITGDQLFLKLFLDDAQVYVFHLVFGGDHGTEKLRSAYMDGREQGHLQGISGNSIPLFFKPG